MTIPKLADVNGSVAALGAQRRELLAKAQALRAELLEFSRSEPPAFPASAEEGVSVLLGRAPTAPAVRRDDRIADLNRQIRLHEAAADVLAKEISGEIGKASVIVRERAAPEFKARSRAVALALVAVQKANAELVALQDQLVADGVVGASGMASVPVFLGWPNDPYGAANIWLREAVKDGVITTKDLPAGANQ